MNYVLDTNILVFYLKIGENRNHIDEQYGPFKPGNTAIISVVTVAEIGVLARRNKWGKRRMRAVEKLYNRLVIVDVNSMDIIRAYIDIDSFSDGKHPTMTNTFSARNMGKNDVWIAATAVVTDSELLTADKDFNHLGTKFFKVNLISST